MQIKEAVKWVYLPMTIAIIAVSIIGFCYKPKSECKIAYVDTPRLLSKFSVADSINRLLQAAQNEYDGNVKIISDSINACMQLMSREYNAATIENKLHLKKRLSELNVTADRYRKSGYDQLMKMQQEKMKELEQKVNPFISEFGEKHGYDLILGTTSYGNILYGSKNKRIDITEEVVKDLNERFK